MDDKQFITEIKNGHKEYLNKIAEKYYDDIYRFCCYQTSNAEDSYDLAQETFLRFIRYIETYRHRNLKGYLLTIAMNLCRDYFHTHRLRCEEQLHSESIPQDNAGVIVNSENTMLLNNTLTKLTVLQRESIILHFYYGFKIREIAHMCGSNTSTIKSRIKQGMDKLKIILLKEDFYE